MKSSSTSCSGVLYSSSRIFNRSGWLGEGWGGRQEAGKMGRVLRIRRFLFWYGISIAHSPFSPFAVFFGMYLQTRIHRFLWDGISRYRATGDTVSARPHTNGHTNTSARILRAWGLLMCVVIPGEEGTIFVSRLMKLSSRS